MERKRFKVNAAQSNVEWVGRKITGAHNGTIQLVGGYLQFDGMRLVAGEVIADTASIRILDIADPATNAQFAGHLASDDFFSSEKYPQAILRISSAVALTGNTCRVQAGLTIKGITHPLVFDAVVVHEQGSIQATAKLIIDRTQYNMKFRSGNFFTNLGDTLIYDNFELNVILTAVAIADTATA